MMSGRFCPGMPADSIFFRPRQQTFAAEPFAASMISL
jgi:hypothetical protein